MNRNDGAVGDARKRMDERDDFDIPERFAYLIEQARTDERERIAAAIEADVPLFCEGCESCDGNTRFGLSIAARIARTGR